MRKTDLLQVDTYRIFSTQEQEKAAQAHLHAHPQWRSALEIIVSYQVCSGARHWTCSMLSERLLSPRRRWPQVKAFADDKLFNSLIVGKWQRFGLGMYLRRTIVPNTLLLALFLAVVLLRGAELDDEGVSDGRFCLLTEEFWNGTDARSNSSGGPFGGFQPIVEASDPAASQAEKVTTAVCQGVLGAIGEPVLLYKAWRHSRSAVEDVDTDEDGRISVHEALLLLFKNLHSLLDLAGAVALAAMLAARLACDGAAERVALALGSACLFGNLLNVLMPFKFVGCLVITLLNIIVGDVCRFFCVFCSLQLGFACALYILFRGAGGGGDVLFFGGDLGSVVLRLVWVSLGDTRASSWPSIPTVSPPAWPWRSTSRGSSSPPSSFSTSSAVLETVFNQSAERG